MSELRRRLFKVVGEGSQAEPPVRVEPIEEAREGIAQLLRQTRERYGQSLRDVSTNLRIRLAYLQAIEDGRFSELPGPTYAVGFVRSYAEYLGLDSGEIVRRFKGEVEGLDNKVHLSFPEPVTEGKVPGGAIILLSLIVIAAGYGGWYFASRAGEDGGALIPRLSTSLKSLVGGSQPPVEVAAKPGTPAPAAGIAPAPAAARAAPSAGASGTTDAAATPPAAPQSSAAEAASDSGAAALAPASAPAETDAASGVSGSGDVAGSVGEADDAGGAAEPLPAGAMDVGQPGTAMALPEAPSVPAAPALETAAAGSAAQPAPQPGPSAGRVTLHARLASWVQIRDAAGTPLITRTLAAGETLTVPSQPGLMLFTGNAGGLDLMLDGKPLPPLGAVGVVRRNIPLDPATLARGLQ